MTVTVTAGMAEAMRAAIDGGDYASSSEIVREALRDWRDKRSGRQQALVGLRTLIAEGLADIEAGRVTEFQVDDIKRLGRELSRRSEESA